MVYGDYKQMLEDDENLIVYRRHYDEETWIVICNFYEKDLDMPENIQEILENEKGTLLFGNYADVTAENRNNIRPYEARIYCL